MGKIYKVLFFIFLSTKVFAYDFGLEMAVGKFTPPEDLNLSNATYTGLRTNFYITENFAVTLKYDVTREMGDSDLCRYVAGFRYQVTQLDTDFNPYFDIGRGKEKGSYESIFYQFTMGGKYYFTNSFNVLGEANIIKIEDLSTNYSFGLGVGYDFYREPSTSQYSEKPVDERVMKNLVKNKKKLNLDLHEDIFLTPY